METYILAPGDLTPYSNVLACIGALDRSKTWKVVIGEDKESRSNKQNRLQWMWHAEWAKCNGHTKDYAYNRFKYKYCLPIMLADTDEKFVPVRKVYDMVRGDKDGISAMVKILHTKDLSTKQMAQALDEYDMDSASQGCVFSDPEEFRMLIAMEQK